jgi:hypothetical protein
LMISTRTCAFARGHQHVRSRPVVDRLLVIDKHPSPAASDDPGRKTSQVPESFTASRGSFK